MTIRFHDSDSHISISNQNEASLIDHVPAGVYTFRQTLGGPILQKDRKRFEIADRKYGKHSQHLKTIMATYDRLNPSVGVIMEGIKGAGKSMLSEDICNASITMGMPVYRIDTALSESELRFLVACSPGGYVLYFDEFGKIYGKKERKGLLSFFADQSLRGGITILTANDLDELSGFMIDRPGRFQFRLRFEGLEVDAAREVAAAYRLDEAFTEVLARTTAFHPAMSYDILIAMARMATEATSLEDLEERMQISNVPALAYNHYELTRVSLGDQRYGRDNVKVKVVDDMLILTALDGEGNILIQDESINLMDSAAVHMDTEVDYPNGLRLGTHSLRVVLNGHTVRLLFRRALADVRNRMNVSLPAETKRETEKDTVDG